ncbi:uncharacterized protein FFB20_15924 [Fusarium fujikuroi]|nr:uncharacterized protein FFB20_15924 [Fusarium fujikuroi]
MLWISI